MMIPTLCLVLRGRRGESFCCDNNTRAFCAEDAERISFLKTRFRNDAQIVSIPYSNFQKILNFSFWAKIFEKWWRGAHSQSSADAVAVGQKLRKNNFGNRGKIKDENNQQGNSFRRN